MQIHFKVTFSVHPALLGDGRTFSRTQICCVRCVQIGANRCSFSNNMTTWLTADKTATPAHLTSTWRGAEDVIQTAVIPIPFDSLWDILRWYCTLFGSPPLYLCDQRLRLLMENSKRSLLFCWQVYWQVGGRAMIITAPIRCPWNWHRRPIALLAQEEKRDSWRVRRRGQRGRGEKTEDKVTKGVSQLSTGRMWSFTIHKLNLV